MDKLRALQYFIAAAEEGSLAGAARRLEVSVPAVQKLLGAFEHALGTALFERNTKGVRLTANGSNYLEQCRPLLDQLLAAEEVFKQSGARPAGTVIVACHSQLAHHILIPAIPLFRYRYPEIQIDLRTIHRLADADANMADVLLLHGWPEPSEDFIHQRLGMARSYIVASPEYWAVHGLPQHPNDLAQHDCLLMRNPYGIVIDLWEFTRGEERASVQVNGWLLSNDREVLLDAVMGGQGVGRFTEITTRSQVQNGRLVPVLQDWVVHGGPPVNLLYKPSARRTPRTKLFVEFVLQQLQRREAEGDALTPRPPVDRPGWHRRGYGRASSSVRPRPT